MSEHASDFVHHMMRLLESEDRHVAIEYHEPNRNQAWKNRDGKYIFNVSNKEHWRTFRVTVEAVNHEHVFDPDHPETRKLIDAFKRTRLQNIHRLAAYRACVEDPEKAFRYWIEQIGDSELYRIAYEEGVDLKDGKGADGFGE